MANVIKHKRGSGSDPGASDLVVGEVAIRTDVGKLFTKMDNGSVAEIAGGGSDIAINTLSSSSATGGGSATFNGSAYRFTLSAPPSVSAQQLLVSINGVIQKPVAGTGQPSEGFSVSGNDIILGDAPATGADFFILTFKSLGVSEPADNSVTSAKIVDGAIVNADINASAAIAKSKLASLNIVNADVNANAAISGVKINPSFTSNISINNSFPSLFLNDTEHDSDFSIQNQDGTFGVKDETNSLTRLTIASNGATTLSNTLTVGGGITSSTTGNASLTLDAGTGSQAGNQVSFIDFKLDGTLKGNIAINEAASGTPLEINSGGTGSTQLFNASSLRLNTSASGVDVTGSITLTSELDFIGDNNKFVDFHTLNSKYVEFRHFDGGSTYHKFLRANATTGTELFFNGSKKLETINTGVRIENTTNLGTTTGNAADLLQLHQTDATNVTTYDFMNYRFANGSTHASSEMRFRRHVDVTDQGYLGLRDGAVTFGYGNNERMRLTHDGKLGLATTNPLTIADFGGVSSLGLGGLSNHTFYTGYGQSGSAFSGIVMGAGVNGNAPFIASARNSSGNGLPLYFYVDGNERIRIVNGGNKNIHFNADLSLPGLGNTNQGIALETSLGSAFLSRNGSASLYVNNNGSGDQDLVVFAQNGTTVSRIKTQSNTLASDQKVKKDIEALPIGLDFVNKLAPKQFRYTFSESTDPICYGLIAQELEASLTSSGVSKDSTSLCQYKALKETDNKDTSEYWVDYTKMIPVLIKAVQELTAKVEALEAK